MDLFKESDFLYKDGSKPPFSEMVKITNRVFKERMKVGYSMSDPANPSMISKAQSKLDRFKIYYITEEIQKENKTEAIKVLDKIIKDLDEAQAELKKLLNKGGE